MCVGESQPFLQAQWLAGEPLSTPALLVVTFCMNSGSQIERPQGRRAQRDKVSFENLQNLAWALDNILAGSWADVTLVSQLAPHM